MYSLYANSGEIVYGIKKYIVDTEAEVSSLPVEIKPGSSCKVLETSNIYVLNHNKEWVNVQGGAANGDWIDFGVDGE